jgi:hypothetical protein
MKRLLPILLVLGALAACSDDPTGPDGSGGGPSTAPPDTLGPLTAVRLEIGDRWSGELTWSRRVLTPERQDYYPPEIRRAEGTKEMVATEAVLGGSYHVERTEWRFDNGESLESFRRYRQDESGLYRLFADLTAPPGALEGIDDAEEIKRLQYPVEADKGWTNLDATRSRVEAKEMVETGEGEVEAYRILVSSHRDGPDDFIYVWFNEDGLVQRHNHTELNAYDPGSGEILIVVIDEVETLRRVIPPVNAHPGRTGR